MKNRTAYIIKSNFSFYEKIFANHGLNKKFKFLSSDTCLNDLICSNHSDINLYNGRLHLALNLQDTDFYIEEREDGKRNIPGLAKVRIKEEFNNYGTLDQAFAYEGVRYNKTERAYINNIGDIKYTSKCHFQECFNVGYTKHRRLSVAANILKSNTYNQLYGLTKNQSHASIPLSIGNKLKLDVIYNKLKNKIIIGTKIININHRLKVNLYPFGLLAISISHSITSNSLIDANDLIIIQKVISKDNLVKYKKKEFDSLNSFFQFIQIQFKNSVFEKAIDSDNKDLGDIATINFSNDEYTAFSTKEIIGILDLDLNYRHYSDSYIDSYKSIFGKYENDITIIKNDRLLYLFDNKWDYLRSKPLFYWAFSDTFSSLFLSRKLFKMFSKKLKHMLTKSEPISKKDIQFINSLNQFILNLEQYKKLPRPLRKLFYHLGEKLDFYYNREVSSLQEILKQLQLKSNRNDFIDYFTLKPNFMGIGIDVTQIIRKIKLNKLDLLPTYG